MHRWLPPPARPTPRRCRAGWGLATLAEGLIREALRLFVQHGARYAFPATRGGMTRGWPTGYATEPLRELIVQPNEPPPVWPAKDGPVRGVAFHPLYPSTSWAVAQNPALYQLLALFDAIRGGSPRERALALPLLEQRLA